MPQEAISDSVFRTVRALNTISPVMGHTPAFARVPATTAMASTSSSIAQSMK